jgi:hypothetical protein
MQDHGNFSILTETVRRRLFLQTNSVFNKEIRISTIFHAISNRCRRREKHEFEITNDIVFIQGFIAACDIHFSFFTMSLITHGTSGLFWWVL